MAFPRIETARLMMRPFAIDDVDDLHRLWVDPGVRKFLWDDQVIPRETAIAVVESSIESFVNHGFGFWAICFKNDPELIGFGGLRHFTEDGAEESEVEILYGVAPAHWGKGIATEAAGAVAALRLRGARTGAYLCRRRPPQRRFFSRDREIRNEVRPKNYDQRRGNPLLRDESGRLQNPFRA
jgi:hypothetical protein